MCGSFVWVYKAIIGSAEPVRLGRCFWLGGHIELCGLKHTLVCSFARLNITVSHLTDDR